MYWAWKCSWTKLRWTLCRWARAGSGGSASSAPLGPCSTERHKRDTLPETQCEGCAWLGSEVEAAPAPVAAPEELLSPASCPQLQQRGLTTNTCRVKGQSRRSWTDAASLVRPHLSVPVVAPGLRSGSTVPTTSGARSEAGQRLRFPSLLLRPSLRGCQELSSASAGSAEPVLRFGPRVKPPTRGKSRTEKHNGCGPWTGGTRRARLEHQNLVAAGEDPEPEPQPQVLSQVNDV